MVFSGHGSPMIAIEHNDITEGMASVGRKVLEEYGRPKAILAISAHWFSRGTFIQSQEEQGRFTICMVFRKSCIR